MNESDARHVVLVRAFEDPPVAPWTEADALWANEAGARAAGEDASDETYIRQRARVAHHRLADRTSALRAVEAGLAWPAGIGWPVAALAFGIGIASDAIGSSQRINILAPPLLALIAWNLVVYLAIGLAAAWPGEAPFGPLRRGALALIRSLKSSLTSSVNKRADWREPALARFATDWSGASRRLTGARIATVLHCAAAALVCGALASLYLRGLAFEYRAGWDSTFLTAPTVHRLLAIVLGPASALTGIRLPDDNALAALRFSAGPGENAARWIHLYALTMLIAIVLPRALLALAASARARHLTRRMPLSLDEPYFKRLLRGRHSEPLAVDVLPYSYRVTPAFLPGIGAALQTEFGSKVSPRLAETVTLGDGPEFDPRRPDGAAVALFPLTATPERETHGAFVAALTQMKPGRVAVLIDESGFRQRFPGSTGEARLAQRREAWQRLMNEQGLQPRFADLSGSLASTASAPAPRR